VHVLIAEEKAFSQGPERVRALAQGRDQGARPGGVMAPPSMHRDQEEGMLGLQSSGVPFPRVARDPLHAPLASVRFSAGSCVPPGGEGAHGAVAHPDQAGEGTASCPSASTAA